jgi:hypothetical protein
LTSFAGTMEDKDRIGSYGILIVEDDGDDCADSSECYSSSEFVRYGRSGMCMVPQVRQIAFSAERQ